MAGPKHPRHYDGAFKRQIVQSCESGKPSRRSGPSTTSRDRPAALGPRHPRPAVGDGGGRFRTSGAGIHTKADVIRANAARYRRDAGCWASPIHLLLDDRASRDGACGSDRRRRARGPARQPRTLRRQEDQGRLGKEGRHRVQEAHRRHHVRTGHDERVHAQTIQTARDAGQRGEAREPAGPRVRRLRPARAAVERSYLCPSRRTGC